MLWKDNHFYQIFFTQSQILFEPNIGDYINSKEYRKPEWVTHMEEIQKRLNGEFFQNSNNVEKI